MTQTVSPEKNKKINIPLHYGISLAANNKSVFAVCTAMHLLGVPAVLVSVMVYLNKVFSDSDVYFRDYFSESSAYIVIAVIALIIAFLNGTNAAMNSFKHLYSKQQVDMELSLPLSSKERFVSGYFSGLAVYILPFIGAEIISCILFLIGHLSFDGKAIPKRHDYYLPETVDFFEDYFPIFAKTALGGLLLMIMFYTMWVLTMTFCGSKLEATLYGAGANIVMPAIYSALMILIQNNMYGADNSLLSHDPLSAVFYATSPIGAGISLALCLAGEDGFTYLGYVLPTFICTAVFFAAAYFSYRRRRAEETGKSFAVKEFYYVVLTCMVFFVMVAFNSMGSDMLIPSLIITCAAYVILDCLSARGMRKIGMSFVKYIVTAVGSSCIIWIITATGFFGAENRIPSVSEIESVTVNRYYYNVEVPQLSVSGDAVYRSREALTTVTDMHRRQLEFHKADIDTTNVPLSNVYITYMLKNGFTMTRRYDTHNEAYTMLLPLQTCDEMKQRLTEETEELSEKIKDMKNIRIVYDRDRGYDNAQVKYADPNEFAAGFKAAYTEDIQNMTEEALIRPKHKSYGTVTVQEMKSSDEYSRSEWAEIPACFEKTAEYLRSLDFRTDDNFYVDEDYTDILSVCRFIPDGNMLSVNDGKNTGLMSVTDPVFFQDNRAYMDSHKDELGITLSTDDMDNTDIYILYSIYSRGISDYIPDSECYTIAGGGTLRRDRVYVPEEYNSEIERILEKYTDYGGDA